MEVVIFDGACHLCTGSVQFILRHEAAPSLMFAPLQSGAARALLTEHDVEPDAVDSMLLVSGRQVYVRSSAALRIARHLRGRWRVLRVLWLVPSPVRDWLYDFVAEHRYRWFGRAESCMAPTPELRARFLIDDVRTES